jgi:hypothetical protein
LTNDILSNESTTSYKLVSKVTFRPAFAREAWGKWPPPSSTEGSTLPPFVINYPLTCPEPTEWVEGSLIHCFPPDPSLQNSALEKSSPLYNIGQNFPIILLTRSIQLVCIICEKSKNRVNLGKIALSAVGRRWVPSDESGDGLRYAGRPLWIVWRWVSYTVSPLAASMKPVLSSGLVG